MCARCEEDPVLGWIDGQLPWWVIGPGVGLCVVALYGLADARLGVSGAWLATISRAEGWQPEPWGRSFLLALGYGARWAGGCTSGHGLSGCAVASPDSLVTTATFFSVAVLVTLALHALTGGAL